MSIQLEEKTAITLPKGTLLLLFEFLARSYDSWRRMGNSADDSFSLQKPDPGERIALWHLEGEIERTLPEVFAPDFQQLISVWKQKLAASSPE
jgi:hypothetical protein